MIQHSTDQPISLDSKSCAVASVLALATHYRSQAAVCSIFGSVTETAEVSQVRRETYEDAALLAEKYAEVLGEMA